MERLVTAITLSLVLLLLVARSTQQKWLTIDDAVRMSDFS